MDLLCSHHGASSATGKICSSTTVPLLNTPPPIATPSKKRLRHADVCARDIRLNNELGVAAIAGRVAAEDYNLNILSSGIEDDKQNYTRFFILSRKEDSIEVEAEKATLSFQLHNEVGSLSKVLSMFYEFDVNLTRIQSLPRIGFPDEYTFHVDCDWTDYADYKESIRKIKTMVSDLTILGEYKKGEIHNSW